MSQTTNFTILSSVPGIFPYRLIIIPFYFTHYVKKHKIQNQLIKTQFTVSGQKQKQTKKQKETALKSLSSYADTLSDKTPALRCKFCSTGHSLTVFILSQQSFFVNNQPVSAYIRKFLYLSCSRRILLYSSAYLKVQKATKISAQKIRPVSRDKCETGLNFILRIPYVLRVRITIKHSTPAYSVSTKKHLIIQISQSSSSAPVYRR